MKQPASSTLSEKDLLKILQSRKYRGLDLPLSTLQDIAEKEALRGIPPKELEKAVREKLHQLVAPYLGDPDYAAESTRLSSLPAGDSTALREWCQGVLSCHASTRERIPMLDKFYQLIFTQIGMTKSILDVACGLNPFSLPWMPDSASFQYIAYDLHLPRVQLINQFFEKIGYPGRAIQQDISIYPPEFEADTAFFFKEAHRFEARQRGSSRILFERLQVRWIVVTLPAYNLTAQHPMRERQRALIEKSVSGTSWMIEEREIGGEMIFFIRKNG